VWERAIPLGLTRKLRNGVGARNSAGWLVQIGCVLCTYVHAMFMLYFVCCPGQG